MISLWETSSSKCLGRYFSILGSKTKHRLSHNPPMLSSIQTNEYRPNCRKPSWKARQLWMKTKAKQVRWKQSDRKGATECSSFRFSPPDVSATFGFELPKTSTRCHLCRAQTFRKFPQMSLLSVWVWYFRTFQEMSLPSNTSKLSRMFTFSIRHRRRSFCKTILVTFCEFYFCAKKSSKTIYKRVQLSCWWIV